MKKQLFFDLRLKLRESNRPFAYWNQVSYSPEPYTEMINNDGCCMSTFGHGDEMVKITVQDELRGEK